MAVCPACHTPLPRAFRAELAVTRFIGCPSCQHPLQLKRRPALLEAAQIVVLILVLVLVGELLWGEAIVVALWLDTLLERYTPWRKIQPAWEQEPWHQPKGKSTAESDS